MSVCAGVPKKENPVDYKNAISSLKCKKNLAEKGRKNDALIKLNN